MAINILESRRVDRYELEVLVCRVTLDENVSRLTDQERLKIQMEISHGRRPKPRPYTVRMTLDNLLDATISNHEKSEERPREEQWSTLYDVLKQDDWFRRIVADFSEQYIVEEEPPFSDPQMVRYNITKKNGLEKYSEKTTTLNKGVICIFSCVPRALVEIFHRNRLELTIHECSEDGGDPVELGRISLRLNGRTGFTHAVLHHFYEKGFDPHTHSNRHSHTLLNRDGERVGTVNVLLRLTCHGPETCQVNDIVLKSNRPPLKPIFIDENAFDFPLDELAVRPKPHRMTYVKGHEMEMLGPHVEDMLHCQRTRKSCRTEPCACPCKMLLEIIKKALFDDVVDNSCEPETNAELVEKKLRKNQKILCPCAKKPPAHRIPGGK